MIRIKAQLPDLHIPVLGWSPNYGEEFNCKCNFQVVRYIAFNSWLTSSGLEVTPPIMWERLNKTYLSLKTAPANEFIVIYDYNDQMHVAKYFVNEEGMILWEAYGTVFPSDTIVLGWRPLSDKFSNLVTATSPVVMMKVSRFDLMDLEEWRASE